MEVDYKNNLRGKDGIHTHYGLTILSRVLRPKCFLMVQDEDKLMYGITG